MNIPDNCKDFRAVLESTSPDADHEATLEAAEKHAESCESYLEQLSNVPISKTEKEALNAFVTEERIWRTCCPSLDALRTHAGEVDDVRSHLNVCEPCQEERVRLLAGEDVVRRVPKIELPDLSKLNRPKPDTPPG